MTTKPLVFGDIEGIPVGTWFPDRASLHRRGVHLATQAGIHGRAHEGCDSIVLSGGYEDDEDFGTAVIYTGEGGRDSSGKQTRDQALTRGNHALVVSQLLGLPVRLIRGYQKENPFSPESGYRYDGLYRVRSHWHEKGLSGFEVWRFRLERQDPGTPPWEADRVSENLTDDESKRRLVYRSEIVRDPALAKKIKELYEYRCQICGVQLQTPVGPYAEGAHIQPLGAPHNGPDVIGNLLCLCPNHHLLFDSGAWSFGEGSELLGHRGLLSLHVNHHLRKDCCDYHRVHIWVPREEQQAT